MPAPGFAALFEVFAETFGLCTASVAGAGFGFRCAAKRKSDPALLTGLGASLLTVFYCLYGESRFCAHTLFSGTETQDYRTHSGGLCCFRCLLMWKHGVPLC